MKNAFLLTLAMISLWGTGMAVMAQEAPLPRYNGGGVQEGITGIQGTTLPNASSPGEFIKRILRTVISVVGILAVIAIIAAGLLLLVRGDDSSKRDQALRIILYVIVGLLVIALASAFVRLIVDLVT